MELHDGDTVWVAFATVESNGAAVAWASEATVMFAEHRAVKIGPMVRTLYGFERVCETESEAWQQCAAILAGFMAGLHAKIDECASRAAQLRITTGVPQ